MYWSATAIIAVREVDEESARQDGAEQTLHDRGVLVIPDFIANAGGVICAAMEYRATAQVKQAMSYRRFSIL